MLSLLVGAAPSAQQAKPIVHVLSTGGTIAGSGSSSTDLSNYKPGSILGEELVKAVPQIAQIADARVEQIANVSSSDLTIDHWLTLAKRIHGIIAETPYGLDRELARVSAQPERALEMLRQPGEVAGHLPGIRHDAGRLRNQHARSGAKQVGRLVQPAHIVRSR